MKRIWRYNYSEWQPEWYNYIIPYKGMDENFRHTLVFHTPPFGFLVIALLECHCVECEIDKEKERLE